MTKKKLKSR